MYSLKLKEIRKSLKLSQEDMANQTGTTYRAYTSYERGDRKPSFEFLEKLVQNFDVNLNWLIANKGETFIYNIKEKTSDNINYKNIYNNIRSDILSDVRNMLVEDGLLKSI